MTSSDPSFVSPVCSVVVRAYNEERHIGRLLHGIRQQTISDLEVILVDSGSSDATVEIAEEHGARIVRIAKEEFSFGRALNLGCRQASSPYLVFASAHVYPLYDDWIEQLLKPMSNPTVALVYGKQRGDETTHFSEKRVFQTWFPEVSNRNQTYPFCNNANAAVCRSIWEQVPYDESLTGLEDVAWARQTLAMGYRIVYEANAEIVHVHEESYAQILNRYRREAIAMSTIYPDAKFTFLNFLRLFVGNTMGDWRAARKERRLARNVLDILLFRFLQFWGTFRGYGQHGPLTRQLREHFYYPPQAASDDETVPEEARRGTAISYTVKHREPSY